MAYRFTDTGKWADEWFIDLKPHEKLTFLYLCENCDMGGFFELSMRKLRFDLSLTDEQIKVCFKGLERGFISSLDKRVIFIKNFLKHQKNLPLNPQNKAHRGILSRFENYKSRFEIDLLKLVHKEIDLGEFKGASEGLLSPIGNGIGNNKEIGIYKGVDFENFWNLYAKKVGDKKSVIKKWMKLSVQTQGKILAILPAWKKQFTDLQFQPHPETFLNQERWNDEIIITSPVLKSIIPDNILTAPIIKVYNPEQYKPIPQ